MRKAIKDTNVVLNMVISPGIILIPSNLIILKEMVPGYNNVLKLAAKGMRFGKNDKVNYFEPREESGSVPTPASAKPTSVNTGPSSVNKELKIIKTKPKMDESKIILLVITAAGGGLISKFLI